MRGPDGMQPTERAAEIAPRLRQGLLQLQLALAPSEFVPEQTDRRFTIACTEYAGAVIIPALIARLRREAPHASLSILPSNQGVAETLRCGRADLAIGSFRRFPDWFESETLLQEDRVWVLGADNPAAPGRADPRTPRRAAAPGDRRDRRGRARDRGLCRRSRSRAAGHAQRRRGAARRAGGARAAPRHRGDDAAFPGGAGGGQPVGYRGAAAAPAGDRVHRAAIAWRCSIRPMHRRRSR